MCGWRLVQEVVCRWKDKQTDRQTNWQEVNQEFQYWQREWHDCSVALHNARSPEQKKNVIRRGKWFKKPAIGISGLVDLWVIEIKKTSMILCARSTWRAREQHVNSTKRQLRRTNIPFVQPGGRGRVNGPPEDFQGIRSCLKKTILNR